MNLTTDKFKIRIETRKNELGDIWYVPYVDEQIRIFFGLFPGIESYSVWGNKSEPKGTLVDTMVGSTGHLTKETAIKAANYAICEEIKDRKRGNILHTASETFKPKDCES